MTLGATLLFVFILVASMSMVIAARPIAGAVRDSLRLVHASRFCLIGFLKRCNGMQTQKNMVGHTHGCQEAKSTFAARITLPGNRLDLTAELRARDGPLTFGRICDRRQTTQPKLEDNVRKLHSERRVNALVLLGYLGRRRRWRQSRAERAQKAPECILHHTTQQQSQRECRKVSDEGDPMQVYIVAGRKSHTRIASWIFGDGFRL